MSSESEQAISREEAVYFRDKLRTARDAALRDSEGYQKVLFAVEQLGRQMWPKKNNSLGSHKCDFIRFVGKWHPLEGNESGDIPFKTRYEMVTDGRNDAMHVGAVARTLTERCVRLAITLEDALMANVESATIQDYMVRTPVCTYEWQRIGLIRQTMLENSFSYLPFRKQDDNWYVVSSDEICRYLRVGNTGASRTCLNKRLNCRLSRTLSEAENHGLRTLTAMKVEPHTSIQSVLSVLCGDSPILVVRRVAQGEEEEDELLGIVNAYDLM